MHRRLLVGLFEEQQEQATLDFRNSLLLLIKRCAEGLRYISHVHNTMHSRVCRLSHQSKHESSSKETTSLKRESYSIPEKHTMVRTWEIIVLVVIGGGGVLILSAIMWAMITRGPPTIPPLGVPGPAHQSTPAQQSAPAHQSAPTRQSAPAPQGSSEDIELTSQTQGVIPPAYQA